MIRRGLSNSGTAAYRAQYRVLTGTQRRDLRTDALDCERGEMPELVDPWEPPYEPWQIESVREIEAVALADGRSRRDGLTLACWTGETLSETGARFTLSRERCRTIQRETAVRMIDRIAKIRRTQADHDAGIPPEVRIYQDFAAWSRWSAWCATVDDAVMRYRRDRYGPPALRRKKKTTTTK